ncbi:MAG TPA: PilZ domain-containing protein [Polyangia bacterium]|nr:PilZ domain-containing protein [Polyangia bacterium]
MPDDTTKKPAAMKPAAAAPVAAERAAVAGAPGIGLSTAEMRAFIDRAPRSRLAVPVLCRFPSFIDFVETQSVNVSASGMFLTCETPPPIGTKIDFEFSLDDGFVMLKGSALVVRAVTAGEKGMGLRFLDLDPDSRKLIDRIVEVNAEEGKHPSVPFDFSRPATGKTLLPNQLNVSMLAGAGKGGAGAGAPAAAAGKPIQIDKDEVRVVLSPATASYFTYNPLLNVRMGGMFIPTETDIPLGTPLKIEIVDEQGQTVVKSKGKVAAKQELRIGIRMTDLDKDALARLQAQVARHGSGK